MSESETEEFERVDLTVACGNCGAYIEEHPGGYCPNTIEGDLGSSPRFKYPETEAKVAEKRSIPPDQARKLISTTRNFMQAMERASVKGPDSFTDEEASAAAMELIEASDAFSAASDDIDFSWEHA